MTKLFSVVTTREDETAALAARLADRVRPGDTLLLSGEIGAGKSVVARSLIQSLQRRAGLAEDVPSPTFTLVQRYDAGPTPIVHADLYRLKNSLELEEISLLDDLETALVIVEWPELLPDWLRAEALQIEIRPVPEGRQLTFSGSESWASRLQGLNNVP